MPNPVLGSAVDWLVHLLLGSIGTTIAILAIAAIGLLMMSGRLPLRRGATVIIGCFILFSAATIGSGIIAAVRPSPAVPTMTGDSAAYTPAVPRPTSNDPYAGASVPDQRTKDIFQ